ncbi:CocE/NonD family hydrolase [Jiella sp. CQZ9-1]|uniref:CocE/NonD family hydrolase n=2 Tax=Jiella flava TaxID=2816857 RepID=A0A939G0T2_9HYPH|nr:CocE/NonD family hydrolase [Jiella flava]
MAGGGGVLAPETRSMTTADGTRLDADIWRPAGPGPWPVLLQRQAYGRRIGCTVCYAHPAWYAAQGYLVVVQDVRGRGTSEGRFDPGADEAADGAETVEWAAALPGSDGRVAMYGFSYQAYNQLLAATGDCPSLAALIPAMGPWDPAEGWAWQGGAFNLAEMAGWGTQIAVEGARRAGQGAAHASLRAGLPGLFSGRVPGQPEALVGAQAAGHFPAWSTTPPDDPRWQMISVGAQVARLRARGLPMLFIGGWYDSFLGATLTGFSALDRPGDPTLRLKVGPWAHFPWTRHLAGMDFGPEAATDTDRAQIAFLDAVLKGRGTLAADDRVRLFDMGTGRWQSHAALPTTPRRLYLTGAGRAATRPGDGGLAEAPGQGSEIIVHDPWRPAPAAGPIYGRGPGPHDRSETDARGDVATFDTAPFDAPVRLAGRVALSLRVTADRPSFDLSATLSVIERSGKVAPLCGGYRHLRERPDGPVKIAMTGTCRTLQPGEALRLSLAASDFPAHPVNPGTGADPVTAAAEAALVTTIVLQLGADCALTLPILPAEEGV